MWVQHHRDESGMGERKVRRRNEEGERAKGEQAKGDNKKKISACCKHFAVYSFENWGGQDQCGFNTIMTNQVWAKGRR
jgi:hypothetical protein